MQKAPQATFKGQVKRGYDTWKRGRVEFFVETEAGSWTVQFYHDVNPGRVVHRYKSLLGKSASIVFKCNRLIIGDKSDGELHIKIPELEATNAQRLVKKITDFNMSTPSRNRAEVGLASSQNGFSGSNGKSSSNVSTLAWLSKKTPPPSYQQERNHTSSAKRKIDLDSSERQNGPSSDKRGEGRSMVDNMGCYELDDDEEEEVSFPRFTEMKSYSKSQNNSSTVANFGKGLGPINFYGVDNSLMTENTYRQASPGQLSGGGEGGGRKNIMKEREEKCKPEDDEDEEEEMWWRGLNRKPASSTSPSNQSCLRSPKVKRPKLSDLDDADIENKVSTSSKALLKGALSNRMSGRIPTLSDPQDLGENEQHRANLDSSGHHSDGQTVGFDNLGNTCFMNSSLQCLSALEPLSVDIQSAVSKYGSQLPPNSVTKMLYLLMKDVRRPNVRPERVREILSRIRRDISAKFASNTQHDALELLNVLVDRADDEISPLLTRSLGDTDTPNKELAEKSNSPSTSTDGENQEAPKSPCEDPTVKVTPSDTNFGWVSSSTVFFHECKSVLLVSTYQKETFLLLPLESKVNMNLQDCIDKYFNANEVEYFCTNCRKLEKGTMTTKVVKRPRCFIMALLRYTSVNLEYIKKHDNVHIPRFVSVADFGVEDMKAAPLVDPVFMLDREEILPGLDISLGKDPGNSPSRPNCVSELNTFGVEQIDVGNTVLEFPSLFVPELISEIDDQTDQKQSDTSSPDNSKEEKPTSRCQPMPRQQQNASLRPGERTPKPTQQPSLLPTPPSDEEKHTRAQSISSRPQPSCSSPKPNSDQGGGRVGVCPPIPPIAVDDHEPFDLNVEDGGGTGYFTASMALRESIKLKVMTPLTVDVNPPKPLRKRNPAGERTSRVTINDELGKALNNEPILEEQATIMELEALYGLGAEFHDANLPSESAGGAEYVSSPAVEAARRGRISTLAMMDDKQVADAEPERHSSLTQTMRRVVETYENLQNEGKEKENLSEGEPQSKQEIDPDVGERLTIKRLANHLADQFAEVEQHIEMAREAAEDFTEIYTEAQCIIEKMSDLVKSHLEESYKFKAGETTQSDSYLMAEQNLLCDVLVQRALVNEEESDDDFDYRRVRRRLISLRYCNVHGEVAKMNHLTNDLAMYLAAKEVGVVVDPDLPKHRRKSSSHDVSDRKVSATSDHNYECEKGTEKSGLGREEGDGECTSQGEVFMEEDIGNRGSLEVNPSASLGFEQTENWQGASPQDKDKTREHPRESSHLRSEKSVQSRTERMSEGKVNGAEEDSSGAMADVSNNATINTTIGLNGSVCDPGFLEDAANGSAVDDLDPLFLGQPVSEWLETELADIDVNGLGEEDLMIYAQALSRFEYLREQMNHRAATTAAEAEAKMPPPPPDSFTLDNIMDSNEDTAISYDDSSTSSAQAKAGSGNASQESFEQSGENLTREDSPTASSVSDSDKDASMPYSPVSERDPIVKSRSPKEELSPEKVPELHCDESLSDLDEPDGNVDDPANVKVKGLKGGQRGSQTGSSSRTKRKLSANEKHIGSSEHVVAKDKQISPINSSPSLTSKVLSPNKGLSNHVNTLPSATVSSLSETNAPKASHGNHSPRQHLSPKASALPTTSGSVSALPSTSGSVSGPKKSESNLNNRDIQMLSPSASQVSPRRDNYSVSQSKTARNELARLRSPSSVSPRKRVCKESAPSSHSCSKVKAGSASKRLLFEDENKNDNRAESLVKRTLAPETKGKGLIDNLPKNFPMQEDLIKGGTLAKSEDGELPDPDGIHKLLSPRKSERPDKILSARVSQPQSGGDDQAITIISNPSNIPHPVPVASSRNNTVKTIKTESHQVLSPSTLRREEDNQSSNLTSSSGEPNMPKWEAPLDDEKAELARITPKSKNTRPQLPGNDEKENVADSLTARERMQNIEMGKADCTYRLVGMVNHHGESLNAGHYTAYSLNFNKQRWYHMDDKHTKATSESAARTESVNSGYVFFYMDKELFERYAKKATERQQRKS